MKICTFYLVFKRFKQTETGPGLNQDLFRTCPGPTGTTEMPNNFSFEIFSECKNAKISTRYYFPPLGYMYKTCGKLQQNRLVCSQTKIVSIWILFG